MANFTEAATFVIVGVCIVFLMVFHANLTAGSGGRRRK